MVPPTTTSGFTGMASWAPLRADEVMGCRRTRPHYTEPTAASAGARPRADGRPRLALSMRTRTYVTAAGRAFGQARDRREHMNQIAEPREIVAPTDCGIGPRLSTGDHVTVTRLTDGRPPPESVNVD